MIFTTYTWQYHQHCGPWVTDEVGALGAFQAVSGENDLEELFSGMKK